MRIFIAEDNSRLGASLVKGLKRSGFAVDLECNGERAFERVHLHYQSYDVIILDLSLPGRDGAYICNTLREKGITIPILILTARSDIDEKVTLLNLGADDYLTKPFAFDELLARLHALLRRPTTALPVLLTTGALELDVGKHQLHCDGKEIVLTAKEFALLEFFMRNPGKVLDREYILEHVWDFNFNSFSNVVDVHVKNLRKKLGTNEDRVFIETVEGAGYRLVA